MSACVTTSIAPQDCPAGTQKLEGCPPAGAVQDVAIANLYRLRDWELSKDLDIDPIQFARDADIPVNDAWAKFIGSTDEGALNALAARLWMIENAEHTVDVMYYIFHDDLVGKALLGALCDAVQRGVDVRFMVDSVGSSGLKDKTLKALISCAIDGGFIRNAAGEITIHKARVQAVIFNSGSIFFTNKNRRSHDKLIVVDGRFPGKTYAITGGRNIAEDYFGIREDGTRNTHTYRDSDLLVYDPDVHESDISIGVVVETYFSLLFLFEDNKRLSMSRFSDPATSHKARRAKFRESLAALKALPNLKGRLDAMPAYMTTGFHSAEIRLAHELANITNKNVVTDAIENLSRSPNSIMKILGRIEDSNFASIRIVSPYLFIARYEEDGKVVFDGARKMHEWLDANPESTIEIVTNSVLTSDNFFTQAVIDMDLAPRLLMSKEMQERWSKKLVESELNPELVESDEWKSMVEHPRLKIYETGTLDDVIFGGTFHHSKMHAKYITADDVGFVGTSNFDYRSRLYNSEMGFFFRSKELVDDINRNTDYLISLSYRWGSPEWLEMRQRLRDMKGFKARTIKNQRGIYKFLEKTGLIWWY